MTVVACTFGALATSGETEELLTIARKLSASRDTDLRWLVVGPAPRPAIEELGAAYGITTIDHIEDPKLEAVAPDASTPSC